jgi:uncharacterized membrane protein
MPAPLPMRELPDGLPIGSYPTYAKAQEAVDYLSDNQFPVENVSIVGTDLRLVEQVTGRLTRGRLVRAAAISGAIWGLFIGAVVNLFSGEDINLIVPLATMLLGAGFGALSGSLAYAATGGKRDFTSNTGVVATNYEVLCTAKFAEDARNLLGRLALRDG